MWCMGSVVAAGRFNYPTAGGILVPWPGMEPTSSALPGGFLITGPQWSKQSLKKRERERNVYRKEFKTGVQTKNMNVERNHKMWYIHTMRLLSPWKEWSTGTSTVVQSLRLHFPNAGGPGSIPGWGTGSHTATKDSACLNYRFRMPQWK